MSTGISVSGMNYQHKGMEFTQEVVENGAK